MENVESKLTIVGIRNVHANLLVSLLPSLTEAKKLGRKKCGFSEYYHAASAKWQRDTLRTSIDAR
jgi:hypothetical protein